MNTILTLCCQFHCVLIINFRELFHGKKFLRIFSWDAGHNHLVRKIPVDMETKQEFLETLKMPFQPSQIYSLIMYKKTFKSFLTALLRYYSYIIQFTYLKCSFQQTFTEHNFRTFHHSKKKFHNQSHHPAMCLSASVLSNHSCTFWRVFLAH